MCLKKVFRAKRMHVEIVLTFCHTPLAFRMLKNFLSNMTDYSSDFNIIVMVAKYKCLKQTTKIGPW